jgi:hypothetical protein
MARMVRSKACWAKAVSLSKVMDLRSAGFDPSEHRQHDRNGLGGGLSGEPSAASRAICAHGERALAVCAYK